MFVLRFGPASVLSLRSRVTPALAVVFALAMSGCASTQNPYAASDAAPTTRVASAEAEDDGLPPQAPPRLENRDLPDDPSEPFSPNYGGSAPATEAAREQVTFVMPEELPVDLPPHFRDQLVTAMSEHD